MKQGRKKTTKYNTKQAIIGQKRTQKRLKKKTQKGFKIGHKKNKT